MSFENNLVNLWLKNIKTLDNKNHLKHGEIYARDGSVRNFEINDNTVSAKVEGAPGDFYNVEIEFKPLSLQDKEKLNKLIKNSQPLQTTILNGNIPEELFFNDVKIIPDSITDFKMSCDCKNKGLFCKHKAAAFHYLSKELLKDPFLIMTLRDYHVDALFDDESQIRGIDDLFNDRSIVKHDNVGEIPFLINDFKFLLDDKTDFFKSSTLSFKNILIDTLTDFSRIINSIHDAKDFYVHYINFGVSFKIESEDLDYIFKEKWFHPEDWEKFHFSIDENYNIISFDTGTGLNFRINNLKHAFFALFAEFQYSDVTKCNSDLRFFHEIFQTASQLILKSALIPEFFRLNNGQYAIRWIPSYNSNVFWIIENLACRCPDDLISFKGKPLSKYDQVICAVSMFFTGFAYYIYYNIKPGLMKSLKSNTYYNLFFFESQNLSVNGVENSLDNWLAPLYKEFDYYFLLDVSQENEMFLITPRVIMDDESFDLADILSEGKYPEIIRNSSIISDLFSKYLFDVDLNQEILLDIKDFLFFNHALIKRFEKNGVEVALPDELTVEKSAKLSLSSDDDFSSKTTLTLDDLNKFDWKIAIGDETFSLNEFENLSKNYNGLVKINNKYLRINRDDLANINSQTDLIPINPTQNDLMHFILSGDIENLDIGINDKLSQLIDGLFNLDDVNLPKNLAGELRSYQKTGFSWLYQNMTLGFGSVLADDMGLGKTLQVLTTILYLKENNLIKGNVLVVAPTSLLSNWQKEIEKFTPTLTSFIYHGINRKLPDDNPDIILTSYGMVRQDFEIINRLDIFLCVIDEAQNIKNPSSKQTQAIKSLDVKHKMALSGTPIENRLSEYWSIFDFINKGYLYSLRIFNEIFIKPIENSHDEVVLSKFKKITSPFILRRHKTDKNIIKDLPDKIVNDIYCNLTVKQAAMYEQTLNVLIRDVEDSEGIGRKGMILKLITSLKQICNHPAQYSKSDKMSVDESGKMQVLINILETILENDEKVIIFTQYVQMGEILDKLIGKHFNQEVLFFHGQLSRKKRDELVDKFQNNENYSIMVLSLKAGGTGLNLTAASNVIHYDLWWNPAVENQATDRAYRIGQEKNVMVYRFITTGTFEERINQVLSEKVELAELAIDSNESFITEMTDSDLKEMLKLRQI